MGLKIRLGMVLSLHLPNFVVVYCVRFSPMTPLVQRVMRGGWMRSSYLLAAITLHRVNIEWPDFYR